MKKAIGLKYKKEDGVAPTLNVKGEGKVAEKIIEIAKEHGIEIREDKSLVEILYKLDVYDEIPEEMYGVVAEILMQLYRVEKGSN